MSAETSWIKRVEEAVDAAKIIPLWGTPPAFPWEEFTERLSAHLELPKLRLEIEQTAWKKGDELLRGLGRELQLFTLELAPLAEVAFLAISAEDRAKLMLRALSTSKDEKGFSHPDFQKGFLLYLLLEMAKIMDDVKGFGDLSIRVGQTETLPQENEALCYEIALTLGREKIRSRLILGAAFQEAFRAHFSKRKPPLDEYPLAKETPLTLHLEIGSATLGQEAWKSVQNGDLVILDRCSFDPAQHKGSATLMLGEAPLFRARLKDHALKILDYSFYKEDAMARSDEDELPNEEGLDKEALPEEEGAAPPEMVPLNEIPLTLTVEAGRLQISVEKLLQMKPGNTLELGISPEEGVYLTVGGNRIARGELVKIGELLGVRILETKS